MSETGNDRRNISKHIFPTSANLLGICFVILSFIKVYLNGAAETVIDELVGVAIILFLVSSILSYTSMRSRKKTEFYEKTADIIFLIGLCFLAVISLIFVFCEVI